MGQPSADRLLAAEQATEATSLWLLGQYEAALQTLQKLDSPNDTKVSGQGSALQAASTSCRQAVAATCMRTSPQGLRCCVAPCYTGPAQPCSGRVLRQWRCRC